MTAASQKSPVAAPPRISVRRLSPQCSRIELSGLPKPHDDVRLLHAMGWETANVHLANRARAQKAKQALKRQRGDWLPAAAKDMLDAMTADWKEWRGQFPNQK